MFRSKFLTLSRAGCSPLCATRTWGFAMSTQTPEIPRLTYSEMISQLEKRDTFLLDVREKAELVTDGRIPHSNNIPLGEVEFAMKLDDKSFKQKYGFDKPQPDKVNLVVHCKAGVRAMKAAIVLVHSGYPNVKVYDGILDWLSNGGSILK